MTPKESFEDLRNRINQLHHRGKLSPENAKRMQCMQGAAIMFPTFASCSLVLYEVNREDYGNDHDRRCAIVESSWAYSLIAANFLHETEQELYEDIAQEADFNASEGSE